MKVRRCEAALDEDGEVQCLEPGSMEIESFLTKRSAYVCDRHEDGGLLVAHPALFIEVPQ